MKKARHFLIVVLLFVLVACTGGPTGTATQLNATNTPTLPGPQVRVTPAPDVEGLVNQYMAAWQSEDYPTMYSFLTEDVRTKISEQDFTSKYMDTAVSLTLTLTDGIGYAIISTTINPNQAEVLVRVTYNTYFFGSLSRELLLPLVRVADGWLLQWDESVILPELAGGNKLEIIRETTPRGDIFANNEYPMVAQEDAVAIGFIPGNLDQDLLSLFYQTMSQLTIYQVDELIEMVEETFPSDYVVLGEATQAEVDRLMSSLSLLSGVYLNSYSSRFYYDGGLAPQAVGHLTYISEEDQNQYLRQGYSLNERFGSTGLELAFEDTLSGERGASLYVKSPEGQILSKLGEKTASDGQSIITTIESGLQYRLQQSLGEYRGAIVVMELETGRILSMVSNPQFDPNLFDFTNQNFVYANSPYTEPDDPVFNRATNGQYPLGSVFKIITMAAGLETGVFSEESEIYCGHSIQVCGSTYFDWTFEKEKPPSGDLTLPQGLMRSCNPWFYFIGEQLHNSGNSNAISEMANDFGLGELTGIEITEQPGNIPQNVNSCDVNVQLAIGQGTMTVTPIQVARFLAAVGNGGTLYRPTLIDRIETEDGEATYTFEPEVTGSLPISDENLVIIQDAMRAVIKDARGTAQLQLGSMPYTAYGKTGTAQNPFGESHAWFAGYTDENSEDHPDIVVAVILENAGEGSEMAAPVFRRAVSLYFSDYVNTGINLPWEAYPYVIASPTPIPTNTPTITLTPIVTSTPEGGEAPTGEP